MPWLPLDLSRGIGANQLLDALGWRCDPYLVWLWRSYRKSTDAPLARLRVDVLVQLPGLHDAPSRQAAVRKLVEHGFEPSFPPNPHRSGKRFDFLHGEIALAGLPDLLQQRIPLLRFELATRRLVITADPALHVRVSESAFRTMNEPPLASAPPPAPPGTEGEVVVARLAARGHFAPSVREYQAVLGQWSSAARMPDGKPATTGASASRVAPSASLQPPGMTDRSLTRHAADMPVMMVVDDLCNFASRHLVPRLKSLWDQGREAAPSPAQVATGRVVRRSPGAAVSEDPWTYFTPPDPPGTASKLATGDATADPAAGATPAPTPNDLALRREPYGAGLDFDGSACELTRIAEPDAYRKAEYAHPVPGWSHGSAVLHAVASTAPPAPWTGWDGAFTTPAPEVMHFVQLPERTVMDTSGGSLAGHAVDAIHRAVRIGHPGSRPVVVNLSYGTHSGPHDGTSMFEGAMKELLDLYDGQGEPELHVVLPAGNAHVQRIHASGWLTGKGTPDDRRVLHWKVLPDDQTDSFLEIWFDASAEVELRITAPGERIPVFATAGRSEDIDPSRRAWEWRGPDGTLGAALVCPASAPQGLAGTLALLAVAPTMRLYQPAVPDPKPDGAITRNLTGLFATNNLSPPGVLDPPRDPDLPRVPLHSPPGVWTIELRNLRDAPAGFHGWVQRDDAAPARRQRAGTYRGRQGHFLETGLAPPGVVPPLETVDPRATLNGIATFLYPRRLWVLGAMQEDGRISRYSTAGPDRYKGERMGADVLAYADISRAQPGRLVGGMLTPSRLRVSGTSIAAAAFSRMLHARLAQRSLHGMDLPGWWPACQTLPPRRQRDGEPEPAPDWLRGNDVGLRDVDQLARPGATLRVATLARAASACSLDRTVYYTLVDRSAATPPGAGRTEASGCTVPVSTVQRTSR